MRYEPGDGASFGRLCGAAAIMRALDKTTAAWSNWLPAEPACAPYPR